MKKMHIILLEQGFYWPKKVNACFLDILFILYRIQLDAYTARKENPKLSEKVAEYIQLSLAEKHTLVSLAQAFASNRTTLNNRFKARYGLSIMKYIRKLRLNEAASLLTETNLAITEIALSTGFNSSSYLNQVFKKEFNASPLEYRKHNRKLN